MDNEPGQHTLRRSENDVVLTGLIAGIAEYLSVDSLLLRIAFVVLLFIQPPLAVIAYIAGWLLIPDAHGRTILGGRNPDNGPDRGPTAARAHTESAEAGELVASSRKDPGPLRWIVGMLLMLAGAIVLVDEYVPDIDAQDTGLAVALIIIGVALMARGLRR